MKRNKTALIIVIILGSICFWFILNKSKTTLHEGLRNFALEDTASVTKIFMVDKNNISITLDKQKAGAWRVNGTYAARLDAVTLLLVTMKTMEVKSPVGKNARANALKSLATGGIKVEVYAGDKLVKLFYVGSETSDQMGTMMLLADPDTRQNSPVPYITYIPGFDGFLTPRFFLREKEWRDRGIFQYSPPEIKAIKVEFPFKQEDGFEIHQLPGPQFEVLSLKDNEVLKHIDTMAVRQYVSYFQNIQYEALELLSKRFKDSVAASTPVNIITVTDSKGNVNRVPIFYRKAGPKDLDPKGNPAKYDPNRIFAIINSGADFATIQYFVFGKLLPSLAYFAPKSIVKR